MSTMLVESAKLVPIPAYPAVNLRPGPPGLSWGGIVTPCPADSADPVVSRVDIEL